MTKTCRERFENFCGSPKNPKFNLGGVWLGIGRSLEEEFRSWHDLCTLACGGQQLRCTLCCSPLHMGSQHAGHSTASANRAARWLTSFRATMLPILCRSCCTIGTCGAAAVVAAACWHTTLLPQLLLLHAGLPMGLLLHAGTQHWGCRRWAAAARWPAHGAAAAVAAACWHTTLGLLQLLLLHAGLPIGLLPQLLPPHAGSCCTLAHNVGAAYRPAAACTLCCPWGCCTQAGEPMGCCVDEAAIRLGRGGCSVVARMDEIQRGGRRGGGDSLRWLGGNEGTVGRVVGEGGEGRI